LRHVQHNKIASKQQTANIVTIRVYKSDLIKACEMLFHANCRILQIAFLGSGIIPFRHSTGTQILTTQNTITVH